MGAVDFNENCGETGGACGGFWEVIGRQEKNGEGRYHRLNIEEHFRKGGMGTTSNDTTEHRSGIWRSLMAQKEVS